MERLRLSARPWIGIADPVVGQGGELGGQAPGLVAEQPGRRAGQQVAGVVEVDLAVTVGGEHGQPGRPGRARRRPPASGSTASGQVEQAADAGPDGLGVVGVDASCPASTTRVGAGRVGACGSRCRRCRGRGRRRRWRPAAGRSVERRRDQRARRGSGRRATTPAGVHRVGQRGEGAVVDQRSTAGAASRAGRRTARSPRRSRTPRRRSRRRSRAASTAFGPSARKSRRSERTERRLSFRASLTRALPAVRGGDGSGQAETLSSRAR